MKKYVKVLLVIVLLILVIGGAGFGYKYLSEKYNEKEDNNKTTQEEVSKENNDKTIQEEVNEEESNKTTQDEESKENSDEQVETAPDFKFLNMDGEEVHLSDYFGKPIVLNFWATWCGPCQMEMPYFDTAYKQYGNDINFLIVDLTDGSRDTVESAKSFVNEKGFSFPIGFDTEYNGAYTYGVSSIPMTLFIDKDGVIQAYQIGTIDEGVLIEQLELLVK
ncbi:MAG: redoxin domain-containing protein [Lachnospiraceae bacterium]|nr:redoxin domain-containing protein [Lachnospiraceae bacterium]